MTYDETVLEVFNDTGIKFNAAETPRTKDELRFHLELVSAFVGYFERTVDQHDSLEWTNALIAGTVVKQVVKNALDKVE